MRDDLGVNIRLTHPAGNELRVSDSVAGLLTVQTKGGEMSLAEVAAREITVRLSSSN